MHTSTISHNLGWHHNLNIMDGQNDEAVTTSSDQAVCSGNISQADGTYIFHSACARRLHPPPHTPHAGVPRRRQSVHKKCCTFSWE